MGQVVGHLVAKQRVVVGVGKQAPLFGLGGVDAQDHGFAAQRDVIGALFHRVVPGVVAAALHFAQGHLHAVDINDARAGGFVVLIAVHGGDGAQALIDLNEDRLYRGRALIAADREGLALSAGGEGIGRALPRLGDGQRAAFIALALERGAQAALPGQEAGFRHNVAGQIEVIGVFCTGRIGCKVDPGGDPVPLCGTQRQGFGQLALGGKGGKSRAEGQHQNQRQASTDDPQLHVDALLFHFFACGGIRTPRRTALHTHYYTTAFARIKGTWGINILNFRKTIQEAPGGALRSSALPGVAITFSSSLRRRSRPCPPARR